MYDRGYWAEAAEKLVGLAKNNHKAVLLLARAFANQGKHTEALKWCEKAVTTDKLNPNSHYLQATILQEQGQTEEAETSFKRVLYLEPDFVLAHFALGNLMRKQEKIPESDRHFRNAMRLLGRRDRTELLPESDGVTAGRLSEIISSMAEVELRK